MEKHYFYSSEKDKQHGPITLEKLQRLHSSGYINSKTLIWYEGLGDWKPIDEIPELKEVFETLPPPVTQTPPQSYSSSYADKTIAGINAPPEKQKMFSKPFSFNGRIRRLEYGISFIIFYIVFSIVNIFVTIGNNNGSDTYSIARLAFIPVYWFILAQGAKRAHDLGHNGWGQIIPIYCVWLLFGKGNDDENEYGVSPKKKE